VKILVADDDFVLRSLLVEILSEDGHVVLAEENGLLAWHRLKREDVDLAILDVKMPEMDGIELLGKIRTSEAHKALPVLMLTIRALADDQIQGYETGADDYLTKPFSNDILLARVRVLARRTVNRHREL